MNRSLRIQTAVLVYQAGLANVFSVERPINGPERHAVRLRQGDFGSCAAYAQGLCAAGVDVRTAACNRAGDITEADWNSDYDLQPFNDSFVLVGGVY